MSYRKLFFLSVLYLSIMQGYTQKKPVDTPDKTVLPVLQYDRRGDDMYVDSLAQLGLTQLRQLQQLPRTYRTDTLRLYTLHHLAVVYRYKRRKVDSSLYYANQVITIARITKNVPYQLKGYLAAEYYHHYLRTDFPAALSIDHAALALIQKTKKESQESWRFYLRLGEIYGEIGDIPRAFDNLNNGLVGFRNLSKSTAYPVIYEAGILQMLGTLYKKTGQFTKAEQALTEAFDKIKSINKYKSNQIYLLTDLGQLYTENGQVRQGLTLFKQAEQYQSELTLANGITNTWGLMALAEIQLRNDKEAILLAQKILEGRSMKVSRQKAYQALYQAYEIQNNWKQAYYFYTRFIALRDTLERERQVMKSEALIREWELEKIALQNEKAALLRDSKLNTLTKQQQIDRLKAAFIQQQLLEKNRKNKQEQLNELRYIQNKVTQERIAQKNRINLLSLTMLNERKLRLTLVGFLSLLLALILILIVQNRKVRKQKQLIGGLNNNLEAKILERTQELQIALQQQVLFQTKEVEFQQRIAETEMSALRAQMNPHFIFNCLNSIQYFTAQNDNQKASDYLTKFARLIRLVLENSKSERVTLANELETLRLYLAMEAMRFQQKVRYVIEIEPKIDTDSIQIPPLLLQPFVENAVWHGLMHKEEGGIVQIQATLQPNNLLQVTITDNGVGRQKAAEFKSKSATKQKSFGMKITADRIQLINQLYQIQTNVVITDLADEKGQPTGTKVTLRIPI